MTLNATNHSGTSLNEWSINMDATRESVLKTDSTNSFVEVIRRTIGSADIYEKLIADVWHARTYLAIGSPSTNHHLELRQAGGALGNYALTFPNALPNTAGVLQVTPTGEITWGQGTTVAGNALSYAGTTLNWDLSALPLMADPLENTDYIPLVDGGVYKRFTWGELSSLLGTQYDQQGTFDPTTSTRVEDGSALTPTDGVGTLNDAYLINVSGTSPHLWDFGSGRTVNLETGGEIFYNGAIWVYRPPAVAPVDSSQVSHTKADLTTVTTVQDELRALETSQTIIKQGVFTAGDLVVDKYLLATIPVGFMVQSARVRIVAAWDNNAQGSIGTNANNEAIMPRSINRLQETGAISTDSGDNYTVEVVDTPYYFYATNAPVTGTVEVTIVAVKVDSLG